jgi:hypothetical protein
MTLPAARGMRAAAAVASICGREMQTKMQKYKMQKQMKMDEPSAKIVPL